MKKKFVLVALVLVMATSMVFAADWNWSGEFKAGYELKKVGDNDAEITAPQDAAEAKIGLGIKSDVWSLDISGDLEAGSQSTLGEKNWKGALTVDVMKMLEADADFGLKFMIGNDDVVNVLSAYDKVAAEQAGGYVFGLEGSYGDLVTAKAEINPINKQAAALSALVNPVEGVKVAAAVAFGEDKDTQLGADANVDIAKLAGLDFDLGVALADKIALADKTANDFAAKLNAGYNGIGAYAEMTVNSVQDADSATIGYELGASYEGIENLKLETIFSDADVDEEKGQELKLNASYAVNGVTLGVDNKLDINEDNTFTMTPYVKVAF